jgi:hypothetical protein
MPRVRLVATEHTAWRDIGDGNVAEQFQGADLVRYPQTPDGPGRCELHAGCGIDGG